MSSGGNIPIPTGQQPLNVHLAGSSFNTFAAWPAPSQVIEPHLLGQVSEGNLANHDANVEGSVTEDKSGDEDSDTTFEEESQTGIGDHGGIGEGQPIVGISQ